MPNLRQHIKDLGYTTGDLVIRWPASKPVAPQSRRRWVNRILNSDRQQHIDMVMGLPAKAMKSHRGEWEK